MCNKIKTFHHCYVSIFSYKKKPRYYDYQLSMESLKFRARQFCRRCCQGQLCLFLMTTVLDPKQCAREMFKFLSIRAKFDSKSVKTSSSFFLTVKTVSTFLRFLALMDWIGACARPDRIIFGIGTPFPKLKLLFCVASAMQVTDWINKYLTKMHLINSLAKSRFGLEDQEATPALDWFV